MSTEDKKVSQDWIDDCTKFYGKVLTGADAHWCPDWDFLPIDSTCKEIECCTCGSFDTKEENKKL